MKLKNKDEINIKYFSKYSPLCSQSVVQKKKSILNHVTFNKGRVGSDYFL